MTLSCSFLLRDGLVMPSLNSLSSYEVAPRSDSEDSEEEEEEEVGSLNSCN